MAFRGAASRRRLLQRGRWVASPSLTHDQASSMIHFAPPSTEPVEAAKSSKDDPWHPTTMQASIIPTRHFQRSLPRLPIPSLSSTLNKMMQHATPLLAPAQLAQLRQSIDVFAEREGKTLQEELTKTDRANQHTSFISSDWFEMMLRDRSPLGLHNYRTIVCRQPSATAPLPTGVDDSIYRAACWIVSSVRWYQLYLNNELPPLVAYTSSSKHDADNYYHKDWFGRTVALCPTYVSAPLMTIASGYHAFPQDISTSDSLFNTTRVPGILQDELKAVGFHAHIAVQYRGHQFVVTVADDDCNPLPIGQIYARLHQIVSSNVAPSTHDVAALTGLPRSEWSALRTSLLRHTTNQQSLELVDSSMFVLNLEESAKKADASHVIPHSADDCLPQHCSPWLDKSLSIHITGHGGVAVGSESSWGGDDVVQRYADDVARDAYGCTDSARRTAWSTVAASEPLRHLSWTWTDAAKEALANTQRRLAQRRGERSSASTLISFRPSASCTSPPAVNPESMIALAMPLAWWRMQQRVGSVVERISMSTFNRGRVDGVRAVSEASQRFVFAAAGGAKNTELPQMCRDAISIYEREKQDVLLGRGMEAHVLAWKMVSERLFGRQPSILNHPSYSALRRVDMELCLLGRGRRASSPSGLLYQVATPRDDEGVGVHVARIHPDHPDYVLSVAANTASGVSAPDFGAAIVEALNDLECILQTEA